MHVCVCVCMCVFSVCDHLFQGVVSIIHKPPLPRGSMRYIRSLHSTCVCFYAQVSVCVYLYVHMSASVGAQQCVWRYCIT